jgi:hypothetical protein
MEHVGAETLADRASRPVFQARLMMTTVPIAEGQRLPEHAVDDVEESRVRMILVQEPRAPQEMHETGLMGRVRREHA